MDQGWIKSYRKILESPVFTSEGLLKVWIWCLHKATHKEQRVTLVVKNGELEIIHLRPGQFVYGRNKAAEELEMAPSTVHDRMKVLQRLQNLDIKTNSNFSIVTLTNWELYQGDDLDPTAKPTTSRQQTDTYKNDKNKRGAKRPPENVPDAEELMDHMMTVWNKRSDRPYPAENKDWNLIFGLLKDFSVSEIKAMVDYAARVVFHPDPRQRWINSLTWGAVSAFKHRLIIEVNKEIKRRKELYE